jgi:thymidine phosphorylase
LIKKGVCIERGDLIARIHAQSESAADRAEQQLRQALVLG